MIAEQKKSIVKTVVIIVLVMVTILVLFIHKITTPRYLSNIELKINGLVLFDQLVSSNLHSAFKADADEWFLVVSNEEDKKILSDFVREFNQKIPNKVTVLDRDFFSENNIVIPEEIMSASTQKNVLLINSSDQYVAYFKPPYDEHKFILTLSSVVTHR